MKQLRHSRRSIARLLSRQPVIAFLRMLSACGPATLIFLILAPAAYAATVTEHMEISCVQDPVALLSCDYRLVEGGELISIKAEANDQVLDGTIGTSFLNSGDETAILIVVDTSDPARSPVIERITEQIPGLIDAADPHHHIGLASFDTDLFLLADVGTDSVDLLRAIDGLKAKGRTTELYRNVLEAIRLIAKTGAKRKAIVILSDGLAEDYAYHHADVVDLAKVHDVTIHSIGYPRSVAQSVALQTIRRLSDESGGIYVQANHLDYAIPPGVFERFLAASDSGGKLAIDLTPLLEVGASGPLDLSISFQTADQSFIAVAPVLLPSAAVVPATLPQVDRATASVEAGYNADSQTTPAAIAPRIEEKKLWPWFVTLLVVTILILVTVLVLWNRVRKTTTVSDDKRASAATALAYLVAFDDASTRHAIDKTPWRIGRGRNNDLTVSDHSVSRLHAEIRSADDGILQLSDLESLNGVFVNDNRIDSIQLREGDNVDIGDIRFIFTLHDEDYASEEPTVLVRTRTPV